ncbi:MAG: excalibur calcium-binding domain-containing protein [Verrucomicrobiaceae bacterium]|nr:MAG: excalibur calcium-binding domain-containing protein [Verrucomicrobiaceae bacterium]
MKLICIALCALILTGPSWAHPGGLNAQGCHNDRKNGGYHCHRAPQPATRPEPAEGNSSMRGLTSNATSFANCSAARAAGAAPVRRGQPGYGPHLDRDDDGVGCE